MATPQEVRDTVNATLAPLLTAIRSRQAAIFGARGRYLQLGRTHVMAPIDGELAAPDNLSFRPQGETQGWQGLPANLPCCLWIDVYDGPQGKGFVVTAEVSLTINGRVLTWQRAVNEGPETWRSFNWVRVPYVPDEN